MKNKLILGAPVARKIYAELQMRVGILKRSGIIPRLSVVLVGNDPTSLSYIAAKKKQADLLGVGFNLLHLPEATDQDQICQEISELGKDKATSGIVVQLPLPKGLSRQKILDSVPSDRDVDGLTSANQLCLFNGDKEAFVPPAPAAILKLLDEYGISVEGQKVLIVGSGELVGKPLSKIFFGKKVLLNIITKTSKNSDKLYADADIVISAVGQPKLITGAMLKPGVVVIDAGAGMERIGNRMNMVGDVDFDSVSQIASAITPVPGGVGPVTVAKLYENLISSCERLSDKIIDKKFQDSKIV